jgi:hypothetical protein
MMSHSECEGGGQGRGRQLAVVRVGIFFKTIKLIVEKAGGRQCALGVVAARERSWGRLPSGGGAPTSPGHVDQLLIFTSTAPR